LDPDLTTGAFDNWLDNTEPCGPPRWTGVTCTADAVTGLQISNKKFSGSLVPEIFALAALTVLVLSNNDIKSTLPHPGTFDNLVELNLSGNRLYGTIPTELGPGLTNLVSLDLSNNHLS